MPDLAGSTDDDLEPTVYDLGRDLLPPEFWTALPQEIPAGDPKRPEGTPPTADGTTPATPTPPPPVDTDAYTASVLKLAEEVTLRGGPGDRRVDPSRQALPRSDRAWPGIGSSLAAETHSTSQQTRPRSHIGQVGADLPRRGSHDCTASARGHLRRLRPLQGSNPKQGPHQRSQRAPVSYTHLTLPTIYSV